MKLVENTEVQCMTGPDSCAYIERARRVFLKPIDVPEVRKRESVAETLDAETCVTNNYVALDEINNPTVLLQLRC